MDEITETTADQMRLCIDFTSADGHALRTARPVDTIDQAIETARLGYQRDGVDGGTTVYTVEFWETLDDRSVRRSTAVIPDVR